MSNSPQFAALETLDWEEIASLARVHFLLRDLDHDSEPYWSDRVEEPAR